MSSMVERVARAIAKASNDDPDGLTGSLLNENERYWQHYVSQARTAIEAMREPTKAMVEAAYDLPAQEIDRATRLDELIERYDWKQRAPRAFSAMIDAALK